jgi:hemin uptake protein HemP
MRIVTISGMPDQNDHELKHPVQTAPRREAQRTTSRALLGEERELIIEHDGRDYRLRLTQLGKLILTA